MSGLNLIRPDDDEVVAPAGRLLLSIASKPIPQTRLAGSGPRFPRNRPGARTDAIGTSVFARNLEDYHVQPIIAFD